MKRRETRRFTFIFVTALTAWWLLVSWQLPAYAQPRSVQEEDLFTPDDEGTTSPTRVPIRPPVPSEEDDSLEVNKEFQPPPAENTPAQPRTPMPQPEDVQLFSPDALAPPLTEEEQAVPTTEESPPKPKEKQPPLPPVTEEGQRPTEQTVATETDKESRLLKNIRQVTLVGQRAGEGYFSQDGALFVFQSEREPGNPFFQIYLLDLQNGGLRRVSPGVGKATCPWIHPSKKKVLFASTHLDPQAQEKQKAELDKRA
jgi:hypothetical protein